MSTTGRSPTSTRPSSSTPNPPRLHRPRRQPGRARRRYSKAIADFSEAIWLDPLSIAAYDNRGLAWAVEERVRQGDHRLTTWPSGSIRSTGHAYCDRGVAWAALSKFDKAIADYDQAIQIDPRMRRAHRSQAWLRATCADQRYRDGTKAIASATKACELTNWKDARARRARRGTPRAAISSRP